MRIIQMTLKYTTEETFSLFSCFLFQSIRVTHESSAQEGQTEVSF